MAAAAGNPATAEVINTDLMSQRQSVALTDGMRFGKEAPARGQADFQNAIAGMLGPAGHIHTAPITSYNLDLKEGFAHSTTGIPYAIHGTASVISKKITAGLVGTKDPIHAILKTSVQENRKVIIKRKYVVGGAATITPERAPARTVAIKEDVREVELTRYGGDIEMNLNLFLRPADAKEELDMKLEAQRMHLEAKLIEIGYEAIMEHGTNIVDGIMRSNPAYRNFPAGGGGSAEVEVLKAADRIYSKQIFGALAKHAYPIPNLLAATRYASAYTIGSLSNAVMILPHGVGDLLRYTRQEKMVYDISGVPAVKGDKISMELENTFVDPVSGTRILVHHGAPSLSAGSINPVPKTGGLTDDMVDIYTYYDVPLTPDGGLSSAAVTADSVTEALNFTTNVGAAGKELKADGKKHAELLQFVATYCRADDDTFGFTNGASVHPSFATAFYKLCAEAMKENTALTDNEDKIALALASMSPRPAATTTPQAGLNNFSNADLAAFATALGQLNAGITTIATVGAKTGNVRFADSAGTGSVDLPLLVEDAALPGSKSLSTPYYCVDFSTGAYVKLSPGVHLRKVRCVMSSAVIAAPNGEAGELLVGYPMSGVSTSQATETLRIKLRTYLGCCITNPESVFVLPNVSFEGLVSDSNVSDLTAKDGQFKAVDAAEKAKFETELAGIRTAGGVTTSSAVPWPEKGVVVHHGTLYGKGGRVIQNQGHFGSLDSPDGVERLWGARVFASKPDPKSI